MNEQQGKAGKNVRKRKIVMVVLERKYKKMERLNSRQKQYISNAQSRAKQGGLK